MPGKYDLELSVNHYPFQSDGAWTSPVCGFALLAGDWHAAADLYAERMGSRFARPKRPAWMEENGWHGWGSIMMHREGEPPAYRYADQISCNHGVFCFDPTHGHPTPATNFLLGTAMKLRMIREMHKREDPEFFTWLEGCHERFGAYSDIHQGHGEEYTWQIGASIPELFAYTLPGLLVTGISNRIPMLCHTFVQGKPFDFNLEMLDDPDFRRLVRDFTSVRAPAFFKDGRFRDTAGVEAADGVRAKRIEAGEDHGPSRSVLINLWQPGSEIGMRNRTHLRVDGLWAKVRAVYPDDLAVSRDGSGWTAVWSGPVATMIFEE